MNSTDKYIWWWMLITAQSLLLESRPMSDWERKDADEFFWSQFIVRP